MTVAGMRVSLSADMARQRWKHVTVIGVGLIGGSAGLALKARIPGVRIAGVGRRKKSLDEALRRGAIDTAHLDARDAVRQSDVVLLATPVCSFGQHLRAIAPALRRGALVTDAGSTKSMVVRTAERILGGGGPFVGSHPMAGSQRKGVRFADPNLFEGATCIVTPTPRTPGPLVTRTERFWARLGMRTVRMTPSAHDRALARVSHLPHVVSALLMMLPRDGELELAATGLRDTTRLAGGDPEMWRDVLLTNRRPLLAAMDAFGESLRELRSLLARSDAAGIEEFLAAAKQRRDATANERLRDRSGRH
ncbi:MAG TPA: prephenate dehydrogenase [Phycisphaerae bacterium]|nr:prephenate dehydrogenase [Phycisphaerae bacterium]